MTKKDFQKCFREFMKKKGFHVKGNYSYLLLEEHYMIGLRLCHSSFSTAYSIEYGAVYSPTEETDLFKTAYDWCATFLFPTKANDSIDCYPIEDISFCGGKNLSEFFDYDQRSQDELLRCMEVNFQKRVCLLQNSQYVLDQYKNDWVQFRMVPYKTVYKIADLCGLNAEELVLFRDGAVRW